MPSIYSRQYFSSSDHRRKISSKKKIQPTPSSSNASYFSSPSDGTAANSFVADAFSSSFERSKRIRRHWFKLEYGSSSHHSAVATLSQSCSNDTTSSEVEFPLLPLLCSDSNEYCPEDDWGHFVDCDATVQPLSFSKTKQDGCDVPVDL